MTSLFSSPSKTASQAASGGIAAAMPEIDQINTDYSDEQKAARDAIAELGDNAYLQAGENMTPPTSIAQTAPVTPPPTMVASAPNLAPANTFSGPGSSSGGGAQPPAFGKVYAQAQRAPGNGVT